MTDSRPRRVVITGMGLVSPLGNSPTLLWDALVTGRSGVRLVPRLSSGGWPIAHAAEASDFTGHIDNFGPLDANQTKTIRKGLKVMCREIQMGVAAAQHCLADAGLKPGHFDVERAGVVFGCDYIMTQPDEFTEGIRACVEDGRFQFSRWAETGLRKVDPLWLLKYLPNMPACHVAIYNDLRGPNNSLTLREASSNAAVGEAYCAIVRGSADTMIVGATGTRLHPLRTLHFVLQEEIANGPDAETLSRPFDLYRQGLVLGEGAAALLLEDLEMARRRGAKIYAEIAGHGASTVVDRNGLPQCGAAIENSLVGALRSAGLAPAAIGHIHAHGLSTWASDRQEAQAIQRVFGPRGPAVAAAKSYFGNLGAASGMAELIASTLALQHNRLFPILNYQTPDPECPIRAAEDGEPAGDAFLNVNASPFAQAAAVVVRRLT